MNVSPAFADPYACTQLTQPFLGLLVSVKLCTHITYLQKQDLMSHVRAFSLNKLKIW